MYYSELFQVIFMQLLVSCHRDYQQRAIDEQQLAMSSHSSQRGRFSMMSASSIDRPPKVLVDARKKRRVRLLDLTWRIPPWSNRRTVHIDTQVSPVTSMSTPITYNRISVLSLPSCSILPSHNSSSGPCSLLCRTSKMTQRNGRTQLTSSGSSQDLSRLNH
jgi:hypothetical protein